MAKINKRTPQYSNAISLMCKELDNAKKDYEWSFSEMKRLDRLTQDYLHKLELDDCNYKERAKIATQLKNCRQLRRMHKDTVTILEPLVQYLDTDRGRNLNNLLKEVLGKTRKIEERMKGRIYCPRELY